jgi:NAD(P)H-dependent FMN reductase
VPLREKPTAILGASPSHFGSVRAQLALRQVFPEDWLTPDAWLPYVRGTLDEHAVDWLHPQLTQAPYLDEITDVLTRRLKELDG